MGIRNVSALFPEGSLYLEEVVSEVELFVVGTPDNNGVFTISGPPDQVMSTSETSFTLNSTQVADLEDGSYTATSA